MLTRNAIAAACWAAVAAVLIFEGFVWVRFGRWPGYSVTDAIAWLGTSGMARWARAPLSWLWLHKALAVTPVPAALAAVAMLASWRSLHR